MGHWSADLANGVGGRINLLRVSRVDNSSGITFLFYIQFQTHFVLIFFFCHLTNEHEYYGILMLPQTSHLEQNPSSNEHQRSPRLVTLIPH